jgi:beta-phosphoglucomutase-like phosphatase (HAD superfamily)
MLSAILFDLDGTLTNTDSLHFQTWHAVLQEVGISIDREFYDRRISGRLNAEIVKAILPQFPLEQGLALAEEKEKRFREMGAQLQRLPGLVLCHTLQDRSSIAENALHFKPDRTIAIKEK